LALNANIGMFQKACRSKFRNQPFKKEAAHIFIGRTIQNQQYRCVDVMENLSLFTVAHYMERHGKSFSLHCCALHGARRKAS
jgi:hypothetical protein